MQKKYTYHLLRINLTCKNVKLEVKNNYINCLNFQIKDNPYSNIVAFSLKKMLFTIGLLVPSLAVAVSNTGGAVKLDLTISDEHMYYIENLAFTSSIYFKCYCRFRLF